MNQKSCEATLLNYDDKSIRIIMSNLTFRNDREKE